MCVCARALVRTIIFCGEVVTTGLLERCVKTLPSVRFVNLYSISESHDVTIGDLSQWYEQEGVSIGQPQLHESMDIHYDDFRWK